MNWVEFQRFSLLVCSKYLLVEGGSAVASKAWGIRKLVEKWAGSRGQDKDRENLARKAEVFTASSVTEQNSSVPSPRPLDGTLDPMVHASGLPAAAMPKGSPQVSEAHWRRAQGTAEVLRDLHLWELPSTRLIGLVYKYPAASLTARMTLRVCLTWFPSLSPWEYSPAHHRGKQASLLAALNCLPSLTRFTPSLSYLYCCCCCLVTKSCPTFATPRTVACQVPLSMGFPRQEYQGGSPFISPGDLPNPGIKPMFPAWQVDSLTIEPPGRSLPVLLVQKRLAFEFLSEGTQSKTTVFILYAHRISSSNGILH